MDALTKLTKEAVKESSEFAEKLSYWVHTRNRTPDIHWLLAQLAKVFGEETVIETLKKD